MEKLTASVQGIYIADQPDTFVSRRISEVQLDFGGIKEDRHFGVTRPADSRQPMYPKGTEILNRRQITIVAEEELALISQEMGIEKLEPEWLGANILLSGIPELTGLTIGSRILFPNGAGLICMGENKPCTLPGAEIQKHYRDEPKLASRFVKAGYKRRGIVCAVECPGEIAAGDEVQLLVNDYADPMQ
ncbi:MOSC domain-containing protein [Neobacillus muris]|uniref:MOSC domain-containing protein n=1 Tax=Neobacillus muris TaxID=2941334 RepID=UPI00204046A7|nr:MOSC domain-containing protein [Neobacillus muris]